MVIINEKICDNAKECSGIAVCPTGAIFWDETREKLDVDNDLCVSCQRCVTEGCPIGAITVVDDEEAYEEQRMQIAADERKVEELFVERYGASPIEEKILIEPLNIEKVLSEYRYVFIEQFNDDSIQCLLHSIPISEIREELDVDFDYYKCDMGILEESNLYPTLMIYYGSKCLGKIEGYFEDKMKNEFIEKITSITELVKE